MKLTMQQMLKKASYMLISPTDLTPHPLNQQVYGKEPPDPDFVEAVRKNGLTDPVVIARVWSSKAATDYILSGHRRVLAAQAAGLKKIPAFTFELTDVLSNLEIENFVIESNRQRVKTPEQKAREFIELKRIEAELAKQRQAVAGNKGSLQANLPEAEKGQARDKAAQAVDLGARTAEKLEKIVDAADAGNPEARTALDAVNKGDKSPDRAYRETVAPKPKKDPAVAAAYQKTFSDLKVWVKQQRAKQHIRAEVTQGKNETFYLTFFDLNEDQVRAVVGNTKIIFKVEFAKVVQ